MTIHPANRASEDHSTFESTVWENKKGVLLKAKSLASNLIIKLGFQEIIFDKDSMICEGDRVTLKVIYRTINSNIFDATISLVDKHGSDMNEEQLSQVLVTTAKTICVSTMKEAISLVVRATKRNVKLMSNEISGNELSIAYLDERIDAPQEEGEARCITVPAKTVVTFTTKDIAAELIKEIAKSLGYIEKLKDEWKIEE